MEASTHRDDTNDGDEGEEAEAEDDDARKNFLPDSKGCKDDESRKVGRRRNEKSCRGCNIHHRRRRRRRVHRRWRGPVVERDTRCRGEATTNDEL